MGMMPAVGRGLWALCFPAACCTSVLCPTTEAEPGPLDFPWDMLTGAPGFPHSSSQPLVYVATGNSEFTLSCRSLPLPDLPVKRPRTLPLHHRFAEKCHEESQANYRVIIGWDKRTIIISPQ